MTTGGGNSSSKDGADTLLRAIAAAPDRPPEPARIAHFRILGRLGQGGMGVVYRAEDEQLRRTVALKLLPDASGDDEKKQRFLREARSAAAITHPNVAVVHQIGEAEGRIYIAMELVEGENLRARLDRGRLDVPTARELVLQIARGLAAAHEKGIVHRDLKPENVMITPSGLVKILDFGLAKLEVARPSSGPTEAGLAKTETLVTSDEGRVMGTPEYMSPEQALGEALDVRSDVFSFGIVFYEMLAGVRPFVGASTGAVLVAIARDAAPSLRERAPEVDEALEGLVLRCLAKAPVDRFASAAEIVTALSGRTASQPTAQSRTDVEPITRSETVRQRPTRAVAASLLVVAVIGGSAWSWSRWRAKAVAVAASQTAAPSSDPSGPHRGVAITDHPPPKTSAPEAAAAYARALRAQRGALMTLAGDEMERATKLDPTLAAAQLRTASSLFGDKPTLRREHLAAAEQLRSAFDDRDRMLLKVVEADLADPRDEAEVIGRLRMLVQRFPDDAESAYLLGTQLLVSSSLQRFDEGRAVLLHALDLDPEYAAPLGDIGWSYWDDFSAPSDAERALAALGRCLEIAPSAGTCLRQRAQIYIDEGQCAKAEADARTMVAVEPNGRQAYEYLATALAAENAPHEAVDEALRKRESLAPDADTRTGIAVHSAFATALLAGDLAAAEAAARRAVALVDSAQTESEHSAPQELLLDVLVERGDEARALAEAEAFERRAAAWTLDAAWGVRLRAAFMRHAAGRFDSATLTGVIDELHRTFKLPDNSLWWARDLGLLVTEREQAVDELAALKSAGAFEQQSGEVPLARGRALLLAGRPSEAVAPLRFAAQSCEVLTYQNPEGVENTIWWMRSHVLLGQALEQTGDPTGACAAYAVVLDRWRNAKPRSVTLEKAKERSRALSCPKP